MGGSVDIDPAGDVGAVRAPVAGQCSSAAQRTALSLAVSDGGICIDDLPGEADGAAAELAQYRPEPPVRSWPAGEQERTGCAGGTRKGWLEEAAAPQMVHHGRCRRAGAVVRPSTGA